MTPDEIYQQTINEVAAELRDALRRADIASSEIAVPAFEKFWEVKTKAFAEYLKALR